MEGERDGQMTAHLILSLFKILSAINIFEKDI